MTARHAKVVSALSIGIAAAACGTPDAQRELRADADKQALCLACHGSDGKSVSAPAPVLAGQQQAYLVAQLGAFRDHSRADPAARAFMWPMAASLTDERIASLATYFAALPPPASPSGDKDTAAGKAIFEQGLADLGVPACSGCHGAQGQGLASFPRLAGQHPDYLAAQLAAFADESRPNPIMSPMAKNLSHDDALRVSAYLAALP